MFPRARFGQRLTSWKTRVERLIELSSFRHDGKIFESQLFQDFPTRFRSSQCLILSGRRVDFHGYEHNKGGVKAMSLSYLNMILQLALQGVGSNRRATIEAIELLA